MSRLRGYVSQVVKSTARKMGVHLERNGVRAADTLLGLKKIQVQTVLDIGANRGQFAREARSFFPSAEIHCFEPLPDMLVELQELKTRTHDSNLIIHPGALGAKNEMVEMFLHTEHPPSSSLLRTTRECEMYFPKVTEQRTISVQVQRLDDILAAYTLISPVLMKMDVQGFEESVLKGASNTMLVVDAIIIEISLDGLYEGQPSFFDIVSILRKFDLEYAGNLDQTLNSDGHVIFLDAVFRRK